MALRIVPKNHSNRTKFYGVLLAAAAVVLQSMMSPTTPAVFAVDVADTTPPVVSLSSPAANSYNPVGYTVAASDDTQLSIVTANLYNSTNSELIKSCSARNLTTTDYTLNCLLASDAADGVYTVRYNAKDAAGNMSATTTAQFRVDHAKPNASVKSSSVGSVAANTFRVVDFKLHDNVSVASYSVNGQTYTVTPNAWSDANGVSVSGRGGVYGKNTILVTDQAGNVSDALVFYLDNKAPNVTVKPESLGANGLYRSASFKLSDEYKIDKVVINGVVKDLSDNQWSDVNGVKPGVFGAVEGSNTMVTYDVAGNKTTTTFVLDTTAPVATFTYSNDNGSQVTSQDVVVTMTTNEPVTTPEGWTKVSDTTFTRVYTSNTKASVVVADLVGDTAIFPYEVKRIDRTKPVIDGVKQSETYQDSVSFTVTDQNFKQVTVNGVVVTVERVSGWTYRITTPLQANGTYEVVALDKAGNQETVIFQITPPAPTPPTGGSSTQATLGTTTTNSSSAVSTASPTTTGATSRPTPLATHVVENTTASTVSDTASTTPVATSILGASVPAATLTSSTTTDDAATDATAQCATWLGICWYWWAPIVIAVVAALWAVVAFSRRREQAAAKL